MLQGCSNQMMCHPDQDVVAAADTVAAVVAVTDAHAE